MPNDGFRRTDIWREGTWLDLWSVVHLLSGVLIGLGFYFLHIDELASIVIALTALICYEIWERIVQIEEALTNGFMDVVVGMAGFVAAFFIFGPALSSASFVPVFLCVFAIDIVMSVFGWRASQKAEMLKKRMHARYMIERGRLLERRNRIRDRFRR